MFVCWVLCELVKVKWRAMSDACGVADDLYPESVFERNVFPRGFDMKAKNDGEYMGRGHFSIVRRETLENGDVVAAKQLKLVNKHALIREMHILEALKDTPNTVKLIGLAGNETSPTVLYSYHSSTKHAYVNMSLADFKWWLKSVLTALEEMHRRGVIHRDLKIQNIVTDLEKRQVTIIDFGLAEFNRRKARTYNTRVGCIRLKAPELAVEWPFYDCSSDMWSLGIACLDIMIGLHMNWEAKTVRELLSLMIRHTGSENWNKFAQRYNFSTKTNRTVHGDWFELAMPGNYDLVTPDSLDLVEKMLVLDPAQRISARDALKHPLFS